MSTLSLSVVFNLECKWTRRDLTRIYSFLWQY